MALRAPWPERTGPTELQDGRQRGARPPPDGEAAHCPAHWASPALGTAGVPTGQGGTQEAHGQHRREREAAQALPPGEPRGRPPASPELLPRSKQRARGRCRRAQRSGTQAAAPFPAATGCTWEAPGGLRGGEPGPSFPLTSQGLLHPVRALIVQVGRPWARPARAVSVSATSHPAF